MFPMSSELLQAMDAFRERTDLSIEELVGLIARWTPAVAARQSRHKVTEIPTERTIRYYVSAGLIDRPLRYEGTRALYGFRHFLQALSIKALQARYFPLRKVRSVISDRTALELEGVLLRMEGEPRTEAEATPEEEERISAAADAAVNLVVGEKKRFGKPLADTTKRSEEMMRGQRVRNKELREKITYATDAAELIKNGYKVGMSGFTGSGYPKLVPQALAEHILREHSKGGKFRIVRHDGGLHQQRARRGAGDGGRDRAADAVQLRPDRAGEDQLRKDGILRLPPRVGGPVRQVRLLRRDRPGDHRGRPASPRTGS